MELARETPALVLLRTDQPPQQLLAALRLAPGRSRQEAALERDEEQEEHAHGETEARRGRSRRGDEERGGQAAFTRTTASVSTIPKRIEVARVVR